RFGQLLAEQLDRHPARGRSALMTAHAVGDCKHAGRRIDEIAILVAFPLATRIALPPCPKPQGAYSALRSLMLPSSQRSSLPLPSTFVSKLTGRVHSLAALRSVSRACEPSRSVPS